MPALVEAIAALRTELELVADPARAPQMARYMKGQFAYLGAASPQWRAAARPFLAGFSGPDDVLAAAHRLWDEPEREFQYVAVELLRRRVGALDADHLSDVEHLIRTKSWWDTVDALAAHVVGGLVAGHPALTATMDRWIDDDDVWIARTAILHQLAFGDHTDAARLFRYVDRRSADTEFFIRKACGWALRQFARTDPDAVREFVESHDGLSGLTRREALKHL